MRKTILGLKVSVLVLCTLFGVLAGAGSYTVYTAEAASYLSNDPRTCVNCHVMREHYDGWQKASHHAVATCNDCHVPQEFVPKYWSKLKNGYRHSKGFTFNDFHEPIRIRPDNAEVLRSNCIRCHREVAGEISHGLDCVRCHTSVGHGAIR